MSGRAEQQMVSPGDLGIATWQWNIEEDRVAYSPAWKQLRGLNGIELSDTTGESLKRVHREDVSELKLQREKLAAGECDFYEHDHRVQHENGSWLWIAERAIAERNSDGQVVRLNGCDVEITRRKQAELDLRAGHQSHSAIAELTAGHVNCDNLLAILEATTDLIGYANPQREILYHNKSAREALPHVDLTERLDFINAHPDWAQKIILQDAIPTATKQGTWSGELALLDADGNEIPVSQVFIAHKERDGTLQGYSTIVRDIGKHKKTEAALRESERRFSTLAATAPAGIFQTDSKYNCTYVNERWQELAGRSAESALGQNWIEAVHPDDLDQLKGFASSFDNNPLVTSDSIELRVQHPDNKTLWVQLNVSKLFDDHGNFNGSVGSIIDISRIKKTEQNLLQLNDRFQKVLEAGSIGMWELIGDTLHWDDRMLAIYGVESEHFKGRYEDWLDRLHPDDFKRLTHPDTKRINTDKQPAPEFRIVRPDGEIRHIYAVTYSKKDLNGIPVRTFGMNIDITTQRNAEQALLESESKFQRIAERVPGLVYRHILGADGIGRLAYVSSGAKDVFNLEPEELVKDSRNFWDRVHPEDRERFINEVTIASRELVSASHEFRIQVPGKGIRQVQTFSQPFLADNGEVIWDGVLIDQTERKAAQLALEGAQSQIAKMAENIPGMVYRYVARPDRTKSFLYLSSDSFEMFGATPEEIIEDANRISQWIEPEDLKRLAETQENAEATLTPQRDEYRVNTPNEGTRWYETICRPEPLEDGTTLWDGVVLDITNRKLIELSLHEARMQMQRVTENVPGVIFRYIARTDGTEDLLYVSSQSRDIIELEAEEAMADVQKFFGVIHPDDQTRVLDALRVSGETLEPVSEEYRAILPKKGLRWFQTNGRPTRTKNGDVIWDGIDLDITTRKQAELQLQRANDELATATRMKDQFLANMSHELRTPLNAILGMTEGLQHGVYGSINTEQMDSLRVVEQSGAHLLTLINDVLDLAKIESGQMELDISAIDVWQLCENSLKLLSPQAESKRIEMKLNVSWNLPALLADETRIRQVLINLLANAIKFTPEGGSVTLFARQKTTPHDNTDKILQFCVTDTGIGIAPEKQTTLFKPFVQIDSSLSRHYQGTGLGLSLVKRFVDLHSGVVSVESQPGVGSSFTVELPYHQSSEDNEGTDSRMASTASAQKSVDNPDRKHPRKPVVSTDSATTILLTEDHDSVAKGVTAYLTTEGFIVHRARNGKEAIKSAEELMPDVILMDIQLPGMDGLTAIKKLRTIPVVCDIPIIALTGLAMAGDSEKCLQAGANKYLGKPFRMAKLVALIDELVNNPVVN